MVRSGGCSFGTVTAFTPRRPATLARAPSTRMCSHCGVIGDKTPLHVREWTCVCGVTHDRDVNASLNILAAGRAESRNACGGAVSPAA
ncbi:zinc ribbon domain-containing protein [Nocardia higoensis]|uniref:zinc ribbon domain-containing protein n=1 Tax=Nocardia higoensis TaxID=228599 RepID=UPI003A5CAD77